MTEPALAHATHVTDWTKMHAVTHIQTGLVATYPERCTLIHVDGHGNYEFYGHQSETDLQRRFLRPIRIVIFDRQIIGEPPEPA